MNIIKDKEKEINLLKERKSEHEKFEGNLKDKIKILELENNDKKMAIDNDSINLKEIIRKLENENKL
jgi:hypothetical protein